MADPLHSPRAVRSSAELDADMRAHAQYGEATVERGRFVLKCVSSGRVEGQLIAYVNGIPIARSQHIEIQRSGTEISVNCNAFPCVHLPCEVRFAAGSQATDAAPALFLRSYRDVERLVGPGRLVDVRLDIRNGVILGSAVNRVNGVALPLLVGRVNGDLMRGVTVETPLPLEEGAAALSFTLAIEPGDLGKAGAHFEILALPAMTPLAALSFEPSDSNVLTAEIVRTRTLVDNLSKRLGLKLVRITEQAEQRQSDQRAFTDTVVQYLVALVHDRLVDQTASQRSALQSETLGTLREMMLEGPERGEASGKLDYRTIPLDSLYFADGWAVEDKDATRLETRWMGLAGLILNPQPGRPVRQIGLSISASHDGETPSIAAVLDADGADVEMVASPSGAPYSMKIVPRTNGRALFADVLRLTAASASQSSKDGTSGSHLLRSIAISRVTFYFD